MTNQTGPDGARRGPVRNRRSPPCLQSPRSKLSVAGSVADGNGRGERKDGILPTEGCRNFRDSEGKDGGHQSVHCEDFNPRWWNLNFEWIVDPNIGLKDCQKWSRTQHKKNELYCSLLSDSGISMCPWMENASNIYPQHIPNLGKYTINGARGPQRKIQVGHYDETNWTGSNDVECTKMWQG